MFGTEETPCTCPNTERAEQRSKHIGRYQFLFNGLRRVGVLPYWDIGVVTLRKVALLAIVVHARDAGAVLQALLALLLIIVCLALHLRLKPYDSYILDWHETTTLLSAAITLVLGIALTVLADSEGATDDGLISSMVVLTPTALARWQLGLVSVLFLMNGLVLLSLLWTLATIAVQFIPHVSGQARQLHGCGGWGWVCCVGGSVFSDGSAARR